jgi:methionine synthase I (cobalamin-dependent)
MAVWLPEMIAACVTMIGGCCSTTPAHVAAFLATLARVTAASTTPQ